MIIENEAAIRQAVLDITGAEIEPIRHMNIEDVAELAEELAVSSFRILDIDPGTQDEVENQLRIDLETRAHVLKGLLRKLGQGQIISGIERKVEETLAFRLVPLKEPSHSLRHSGQCP